MRGSCCCAGCFWLGVEPQPFHTLGAQLLCFRFMFCYLSRYSLGSIFYSCMIESYFVQCKGQTLRLFLPLKALSTSLRITFGIPYWSYYFMCRLAASSNSLWKKSTWREPRFLVILLLIYFVTRRELTVPLDASPKTFSLGLRLFT